MERHAALILLLLTQAPQRDAPPPAVAGNAAVRGRVVVAGTNVPVPRVIVTLSGTAQRPTAPRTVYANADGAFEFAGLASGPYSLSARPNQYQLQFLPSARTETTAVEGQITGAVEIQLPRAGVIVGRVVDEFGQPMGGVLVGSTRVGDRPGMGGPSSTTDENGRYRLVHLTAGTYYVLARPSTLMDFGVTDPVGYLETFHPGAASRDDAVRVQVRGGDESDAGDMHLLRGRTMRIRGIVTDSQGKVPPPNRTSVSLAHQGGSDGRGVDSSGGFDFGRRVPGKYILSAVVRPESGQGVAEYVELPLTLVDTDADGLVLATAAAVRVKGRVVIEDGDAPPAGTLSIHAFGQSHIGGFLGGESAPVGADLTFTFGPLAGARLLRLSSTGGTRLFVKSVLRGTEDVTNVPTIFGADDAVRIVLTSRFGRIEGTVTLDGVRPVAGRDVIVFGEDRRGWVQWSTTVNLTRTDGKGYYRTTQPLPAGRYYVVAALPDRSLASGNEVDPAILESLIPEATTVTIAADEVRTADLRTSSGGDE